MLLIIALFVLLYAVGCFTSYITEYLITPIIIAGIVFLIIFLIKRRRGRY